MVIPAGVMNEFYEIKPGESAENFRRSNAAQARCCWMRGRAVILAPARRAWDLRVVVYARRVKNGLVGGVWRMMRV